MQAEFEDFEPLVPEASLDEVVKAAEDTGTCKDMDEWIDKEKDARIEKERERETEKESEKERKMDR